MVVVDTSVWSLAIRRSRTVDHPARAELARLIQKGTALLLGPVRQELLTGIRSDAQFETLRAQLRGFPDVRLHASDYEAAAEYTNSCSRKGAQGSTVDFLICAVAARRDLPILTTDADFPRYARLVPIRLHEYEKPKAS